MFSSRTVYVLKLLHLLAGRPDGWSRLKAIVLDSVSSGHSKRAYDAALEDFRSWCAREPGEGFTRARVQAYRAALESAGLASSSINVRLSAVRKLAGEAAENGWLDPQVAAGIVRVKGVQTLGRRAGNWLTREQAETLLSLPPRDSHKGKRDRVILALLLGAGVRREELAQLKIEDIQQRDGRWCLVDLEREGETVSAPYRYLRGLKPRSTNGWWNFDVPVGCCLGA